MKNDFITLRNLGFNTILADIEENAIVTNKEITIEYTNGYIRYGHNIYPFMNKNPNSKIVTDYIGYSFADVRNLPIQDLLIKRINIPRTMNGYIMEEYKMFYVSLSVEGIEELDPPTHKIYIPKTFDTTGKLSTIRSFFVDINEIINGANQINLYIDAIEPGALYAKINSIGGFKQVLMNVPAYTKDQHIYQLMISVRPNNSYDLTIKALYPFAQSFFSE